MIYNKGKIVPRILVRCKNRKTQHLCKFGADVKVVGRTLQALSDGPIIELNGRGYIGGKKGKPKIINRVHLENLTVVGFENNNEIL